MIHTTSDVSQRVPEEPRVKTLYEVGECPPLGFVPEKMHAWAIRRERFGPMKEAFRLEVLDTPQPGDDEVLVYVMAAGVNYNGVWAALGLPVDVISNRIAKGEGSEEFHIAGSDASGIVFQVGKNVSHVAVGDEVVVHGAQWDPDCPHVQAGGDPVLSPTYRAWGYESNWGSFAQFTCVQGHQCIAKPERLTWEAAASYLVSGATAYRMLHFWPENALEAGDAVLVWGGAGGLGSMAIQLVRAGGGRAVAVVSSADKADYCRKLGAVGCIDRNIVDHWGPLPPWDNEIAYQRWLSSVKIFGKAFWEALGERANPRIVIEHPGEHTLPTSLFVCAPGGMVSLCGGTSGYNGTLDLRYLWLRQKRLQGSHGYSDEDAAAVTRLVRNGDIEPSLSCVFRFDQLPDCHAMMHANQHPEGNMAVLVGAPEFGLGVAASHG